MPRKSTGTRQLGAQVTQALRPPASHERGHQHHGATQRKSRQCDAPNAGRAAEANEQVCRRRKGKAESFGLFDRSKQQWIPENKNRG
jgi:hypothetical protein